MFAGEPGVTFVRPEGEAGRNLVLFAPSLGHAVAALPEASNQLPEELSFVISYPRLHGREKSDVRDAAAAFVSGQHLAGAISPSTSRVAVTLLANGAAPQHFSFARTSVAFAPAGAAASEALPLPLGGQVVAGPFRDDLTIACAELLQQAGAAFYAPPPNGT